MLIAHHSKIGIKNVKTYQYLTNNYIFAYSFNRAKLVAIAINTAIATQPPKPIIEKVTKLLNLLAMTTIPSSNVRRP